MELNKLYNQDCMEGMKEFPDKYFDLAIVDPPYFKNAGNGTYFNSRIKNLKHKAIKLWNKNIPKQNYFTELIRISKNQIIWGINYYAKYCDIVGRIIWDKQCDGTPFSDAEIAASSLKYGVWMFRYKWNGMLQQDMKNKEIRIHPTQKPVALYKWLLRNYAKPTDKIIDTHVGSGSSIIAFEDFGCEYIGFELDKDYFEAATKRINNHKAQLTIKF